MHGPRWFQPSAWIMAAVFAAVAPLNCPAADAQHAWRTNFAAARAEAEREQKPLLIHFGATWCPPCAKMERDVLKSRDIKQLLGARVIGVKLDFDQNKRLAEHYVIKRLPSDILIDPHNGRVLLESQGAMDLQKYLAFAAAGEGKFQQVLAQRQPPKKETSDQPELANQLKDPPPSRTVAAEALVGLDGYSPVALSKSREWVRGVPKFTWEYQGITYQMQNAAELEEFRQDPGAFAPRLLGCDPVILFETDRAIPGKTVYGAFFDDELYLFTTAENRQRFKHDPPRFTKTQHVFKADEIDRTASLEGSHLKFALEPADAATVTK